MASRALDKFDFMKYLITLLAALFVCEMTFSQDRIVLNSGETVKAKVLEITTAEIKYKKYDRQDGPVYSVSKEDVIMISYESGEEDTFVTAESRVELSTPMSSKQGGQRGSTNGTPWSAGSIFLDGGSRFFYSLNDEYGILDLSLGKFVSDKFAIVAGVSRDPNLTVFSVSGRYYWNTGFNLGGVIVYDDYFEEFDLNVRLGHAVLLNDFVALEPFGQANLTSVGYADPFDLLTLGCRLGIYLRR